MVLQRPLFLGGREGWRRRWQEDHHSGEPFEWGGVLGECSFQLCAVSHAMDSSLSPPPLPPSTETRLGEDNKGSKMMQVWLGGCDISGAHALCILCKLRWC